MDRSNIRIIGDGSSSGGEFEKVKVVGEAVFYGDLDCETLKITGETCVEGALNAEEIKVTGTLRLKTAGSPQAQAGLKTLGEDADFMEPHLIEALPGIRAESIKITGEVTVPGSCEAEDFKLRGRIEAGGVLSAEDLDIKLHGASRVKEIGGTHITVKGVSSIPFGGLLQMGAGQLQAGLIEGDYIYLENTEADHVRGIKVEIGPGCRIGTVEYRDELKVDSGSQVTAEHRV